MVHIAGCTVKEDVFERSRGAFDLMIGRRADGWNRLDVSADGFWNSFLAIPVSAPALLVIFLSFADMLGAAGVKTSLAVMLSVFAGVALGNWLLTIVLLTLLARPLGIAERTSHLVVAANWGSVPIAYLRAVPSALMLLFGAAPALSTLLLLVEIATLALYWRLLSAATERSAIVATALFIATVAFGHAFTVAMQSNFGLVPVSIPAG